MTTGAFRLNLDRYCISADVLELKLLARQAEDRPHVAFGTVNTPLAPIALVPSDAKVIGTYQRPAEAVLLAEAANYLVLLEARANETFVTVAAESHERASEVLATLIRAPDLDGTDIEAGVVMWRNKSGGGGKRSDQTLGVQPWMDIARNYPTLVRAQLDALMGRDGVAAGEGRLVLFHGDPGTGKTTAIRALIHQWRQWAEGHLIVDPDRMFTDAEYLTDVLQSQHGRAAPTVTSPAGAAKCKLVVAEDADAYLRSTARRDAGAALGRLLNTTDGILGQATGVIVLLSTNEELTRLHPALIRPGRCLARTEFVRFPQHEAEEWLGDVGAGPDTEATLAELFEARRTGNQLRRQAIRTGSYL